MQPFLTEFAHFQTDGDIVQIIQADFYSKTLQARLVYDYKYMK